MWSEWRNSTCHAAPSLRRIRWQRGCVQESSSGTLRVSVYAGTNPLTGERHYLRETIPHRPIARVGAQKVASLLGRMLPLTNSLIGVSSLPSWK